MTDKGMGRYVPLTGLLFIVVAVVGILLGGAPPGASDNAAMVVAFWRDNDTKEIISSAIFALAAVTPFLRIGIDRARQARDPVPGGGGVHAQPPGGVELIHGIGGLVGDELQDALVGDRQRDLGADRFAVGPGNADRPLDGVARLVSGLVGLDVHRQAVLLRRDGKLDDPHLEAGAIAVALAGLNRDGLVELDGDALVTPRARLPIS